jgi:hypothetical protein
MTEFELVSKLHVTFSDGSEVYFDPIKDDDERQAKQTRLNQLASYGRELTEDEEKELILLAGLIDYYRTTHQCGF